MAENCSIWCLSSLKASLWDARFSKWQNDTGFAKNKYLITTSTSFGRGKIGIRASSTYKFLLYNVGFSSLRDYMVAVFSSGSGGNSSFAHDCQDMGNPIRPWSPLPWPFKCVCSISWSTCKRLCLNWADFLELPRAVFWTSTSGVAK
jgi:hypothetical protein